MEKYFEVSKPINISKCYLALKPSVPEKGA